MSTVRPLVGTFVGTPSGPVYLDPAEERQSDDPLVVAHPGLFTEPVEPARQRFSDGGLVGRRSSGRQPVPSGKPKPESVDG